MEKKHSSPEFVVIRQNEANAKFFVASFSGQPAPDSSNPNAATSYDMGNDGSNDITM